jgi:hypothetical protein
VVSRHGLFHARSPIYLTGLSVWTDKRSAGTDIRDLERDHLGGAQAGAIGQRECRAVLEAGGGIE